MILRRVRSGRRMTRRRIRLETSALLAGLTPGWVGRRPWVMGSESPVRFLTASPVRFPPVDYCLRLLTQMFD
ncbi:hypothetical protein D8S78_14895 [Natrialba swarupiae]|nr:hypothetical protein [Natrialba swarupiae]